MAHRVDALNFKLQSKICYHRDASVDYMEIKDMVDKLVEENTKFRDEKVEYLDMINTVIEEKANLANDYQVIKEQVMPMEEQLETVHKELAAAKEQLVAEKHEHLAANHENVVSKGELAVAKEELVVAKEKLAQKNEELEVLRKKVLESEAMHTQLQQQKGSAPGPEPVHSRRVTRSTHKHEMLLQGSLVTDADRNRVKKRKSYPQLLNIPIVVQNASRGGDLEVVRQVLIKGFTEIDAGHGQYLGIKEMGKLNEKPFLDACAMKLPPSQSAAKASELYTLWQDLLNNPEWKPFKTVTVDGHRKEEVIDADDEKLQGLKMSWGEGPYNSVIGALTERKEYNTDGTESTVDLWNYKEGRKATIEECTEHILDQLKELQQVRPRKYRHLSDFSVEDEEE